MYCFAVQNHSMAYDWFCLWISSFRKSLWMEWKFHYCVLHFTVTTAEFMMLNVLFGITEFIWMSFEHICFFCSCSTFLCDFQNFHVDISKQFTVILKTFLEITYSWQFSSEQEIQSPVMITWVRSFFSTSWICWKRNHWDAKPKNTRTFFFKVTLEEQDGNGHSFLVGERKIFRCVQNDWFFGCSIWIGTAVKMNEHLIPWIQHWKLEEELLLYPFKYSNMEGYTWKYTLDNHSIQLSYSAAGISWTLDPKKGSESATKLSLHVCIFK